ncbi:MAG: hypothetical protein DYH17_08595 [Xanthomonadales bacterium PRO6]|nr:hypothetical protein [Xanthomonadales bacterium PRO6]
MRFDLVCMASVARIRQTGGDWPWSIPMARWISLAITLLCFGSCSFISTNPWRGVIAPIGVIVFSFITLMLFVQARVSGVARPPVSAALDPETQALLRKRAQAQQAKASAAEPAEPEA